MVIRDRWAGCLWVDRETNHGDRWRGYVAGARCETRKQLVNRVSANMDSLLRRLIPNRVGAIQTLLRGEVHFPPMSQAVSF